MSNFNSHPPQTFARLFRPWDCDPETSKQNNSNRKSLMKIELNPSVENMSATTATSMMKTEHFDLNGHESDRECASSSSSFSKCSNYEDSFSNGHQIVNSCLSPSSSPTVVPQAAYTAPQYYDSLEKQAPYFATHFPHTAHMTHLMPTMPPVATVSDYYYAAAAANSLPPLSNTNAGEIAAYAFNPYAFNLMEHEYVRVMAQDAHVKAVNARKQRPKKFKCSDCNTAFSNKGQLKGHERIHTGERPYICDYEKCNKTFTRNEELTRHKRIHTGLKPYPCTICGKKFGRRDHLKKHMKTHMPQERTAIFMSLYPFIKKF